MQPETLNLNTPKTSKPKATLGQVLRASVQPKNLALLVLFLAAAAVCARLGVWQLERAYEHANLAREHEVAEAEAAAPQMLGEVLKPQVTFGGNLVGKRVQVQGEFEGENTVLIPGRAVNDTSGYLVVQSLRVTEDGTGGASWENLSGSPRLPVVRGWVPEGAVDASGALNNTYALATAEPQGEVSIEGWLQASESTIPDDLPAGQSSSISSAHLANLWGGPIYSGYLVANEMDPQQSTDLTYLPRPTIEGGNGANLQNFFYALQWWLFGFFAVAIWLRTVVDDARKQSKTGPANPFDLVDENTAK
ncbi:SURF1 family protein [Timonella senegalensis]|uniref:SURF1 family protein n=1 Tax=Timonella senegalensis TaxID=1465825 RepID=UPI002FE32FF0